MISSFSKLPKAHTVALVGDHAVGKTAIYTRLITKQFCHNESTRCVDYGRKTIYLDDRMVRLRLADTAGKEKYNCVFPMYIRDCSVAIIVYDVGSRQSFVNTSKWIKQVRTARDDDVIFVLVGNKIDLVDIRQVSFEEGEAKARDLDVMFMETSAKDDVNIKALFSNVATQLLGIGTST